MLQFAFLLFPHIVTNSPRLPTRPRSIPFVVFVLTAPPWKIPRLPPFLVLIGAGDVVAWLPLLSLSAPGPKLSSSSLPGFFRFALCSFRREEEERDGGGNRSRSRKLKTLFLLLRSTFFSSFSFCVAFSYTKKETKKGVCLWGFSGG